MAAIRISTRDVFGNLHYLYNTPAGNWQAALANGTPFAFGQAAHTRDEMALKFELERAATAEEAVRILRSHADWDKAEFTILGGSTATPAEQTYTAFCQQSDGRGTIWIGTVTAETVADATDAARRHCAQDWGYDVADVHCLGLVAGNVVVVHWEDLDDA